MALVQSVYRNSLVDQTMALYLHSIRVPSSVADRFGRCFN